MNFVFTIIIGIIGVLLGFYYYNYNYPKYDSNDHKPAIRFGSGEFFNPIADLYDVTNKVISLGLDQSWRIKLVKYLDLKPGNRIIDLATGTGDVAFIIADEMKGKSQEQFNVIGLDPSINMISKAIIKAKNRNLLEYIDFLNGNSEDMPQFSNKSFDRISMSFGIRNVEYRDKALKEMSRILADNGKLGIMEFSYPTKGYLKTFAHVFIQYLLPIVAGAFSRGLYQEYSYLRDSILKFPSPQEFKDILLRNGGFHQCEVINVFQYIVFIYICDAQ
jgi:demethylmenaquinone methyltransferase/2-methoxy-6-polyprenyl-1,4-benzoquinol methylase